jgi:hypothetical protein
MWSAPRSYKEENWGNQVSSALRGRLRSDGTIVELSVDRVVSCKSACEGKMRRWGLNGRQPGSNQLRAEFCTGSCEVRT